MIILTDSREQKVYEFNHPTEVTGLSVGDYSIKGLQDHVAVERKELNDLIGCLTSGRERFKKELYRGKSLDYMALVVEASLADIINGNYRSEMQPKAVVQSLIAFSVRYRLPVWLAGSREHGQRLTESLLLKYVKQVERRCELIGKEQAGLGG